MMNQRQRRTVNYFRKYVIDDKAVKKEMDVSQGKVQCDQDLKELYESLDIQGDKLDSILYAGVMGKMIKGAASKKG